MRKIKNDNIREMQDAGLTSSQINFYINIANIQEDDGTVPGVYYDDICKAINITKPTFYKTMRSLKEKGFIDYEKEDYYDYKIKILNNDFTDGDHSNYLSTRYEVLDSEEFRLLKANEKLMFLDLLKNAAASIKKTGVNANVISRERFYEKYMEALGVGNIRTINRYKKTLGKFFYFKPEGRNFRIGINKSVIKEFNDIENTQTRNYEYDDVSEFPVTKENTDKVIENYKKNKKSIIKRMDKIKEKKEKLSDQKAYTYHLVKKIMRRNKIKDADENDIKEVAKLLYQHKNNKPEFTIKDFWNELCEAVKETIHITNDPNIGKKQWIRELNPAFIHDRFLKRLEIIAA